MTHFSPNDERFTQLAEFIDQQPEKSTALIAIPVSYTHLDVYKRQ